MFSRPLCIVAIVSFAFLFAGSCYAKEIRVALFNDDGSAGKGVPRVTELLRRRNDIHVTHVKGRDIAAGVLTNFDVIIFTGGSGSGQSRSLGVEGREEVRKFVRNGGGYVGICAGAYLACNGFDWGVGVLNAKPVSNKWRRGKGIVKIDIPAKNGLFTNQTDRVCDVLYANGPIIQPGESRDIPPYQIIASFRTELAENGSPAGVMMKAPAIARSSYGKGHVLISSPHPEQTESIESFVETFVRWAASR